jgi:hypothetical protein
MRLLTAGLLGFFGLPAAPSPSPEPGECTLYFFFAPDSPGQAELAREVVDDVVARKGKIRLRTVLLVPDFGALGRLRDGCPFARTLGELARLSPGRPLDLGIFDEEGLALARRWSLARLPALVLVEGGTAHVATGSGTRLQPLEDCR